MTLNWQFHDSFYRDFRGMSLLGNDAFLAGTPRAVTEATTRPLMVFPAPMQLPASPISSTFWRSGKTKLDYVDGTDPRLSHSTKDGLLTIKRNEEQEPKALGVQQSQSGQRNYRSDNSATEYKIIRYKYWPWIQEIVEANKWCSISISIQINIILFNRRLRSDPDINVGRQSSFARLLLFKKSANGRNTRTSNDQNDYYLRFLPSRNTRTSGDHNEYYLRFLPGSSPFTSY